MGGTVGENPASLRAAVFFAILEKPEGGRSNAPPAGRGLTRIHKQGLRHRGGRGGRVPLNFESAGDNPPHFQENSGPNPLSFRFLVWDTL